MRNALFILLGGIFLFSFKGENKDTITKEDKEKMYQIAFDTDSLTPWLKRIYSDSVRYCYQRGKPCNYLQANEYVDSSYILYKRGRKLDIQALSKIAGKADFYLIIKEVVEGEDDYRFKIHYSWACNSTKEETCTQVYSTYRFLKLNGEWKLCSHGIYEEVRYNRFSYVDRNLMTTWSMKKNEEWEKNNKEEKKNR